MLLLLRLLLIVVGITAAVAILMIEVADRDGRDDGRLSP
jgi:hypothetical protein